MHQIYANISTTISSEEIFEAPSNCQHIGGETNWVRSYLLKKDIQFKNAILDIAFNVKLFRDMVKYPGGQTLSKKFDPLVKCRIPLLFFSLPTLRKEYRGCKHISFYPGCIKIL